MTTPGTGPGLLTIPGDLDPDDPVFRHRANVHGAIFDLMPVGVALYGLDLRLIRFNRTWADFIERYTLTPPNKIVPGAHIFDLAPGTEAESISIFDRVHQGETVRREALRFESGGIVSYWDIVLTPVVEDGKVTGSMEVSVDATERVRSFQTLERRVVERTRELERRSQVAEGLRDILSFLNSNRSLEDTLDYILDQAVSLLEADDGVIFRLLPGGQALQAQAVYSAQAGLPPGRCCDTAIDFDPAAGPIPAGHGIVGKALQQRRPAASPRLAAQQGRVKPGAQVLPLQPSEALHRSTLAAPIIVKNETYGVLAVYYCGERTFNHEDMELAAALGDQAALSIENARLRERIERAAIAAERNRLARDLHDSVTQTLFSAGLIAEVLPRIVERDPREGTRRLEELRLLTRGALAEMRMLLLELRPATLTEVSLGDLIRQLAEAIAGRARIPVEAAIEGDCTLPPDVHTALYRIAQEALNNVARHSGASRAKIVLCCEPGRVSLEVRDNGRGFDPAGVTPQHLGLEIMRERAQSIGADLEIATLSDHGTGIFTRWSAPTGSEQRDEGQV
jgi:signal transduction histidine kinase